MLVHAVHTTVKGRARYKVRGLYRSEALKAYLETHLPRREGIRLATVNTLTGSVAVFFNSDNTPPKIAVLVEQLVHEFRGKAYSNPGAASPNPRAISPVADPPKRTNLRRELRKKVLQADEQPSEPWHLMKTDDVVDAWKSSPAAGLTDLAVVERLRQFGPNLLPEAVPRSGFSILIDQVASLPVALLGVAAGISIFTGGIADAVVILSVVAINAAIGYVTESQAEKTIHSLKSLVRPSALVIRGGKIITVPSENVAPGDMIVLRPGSYIPADGRLVETHRLTVDESTLTGESMPVLKTSGLFSHPADTNGGEIPLADRTNMVYMGTLVTGGQGLAVAVATGRFTEIGKIQTLVGEARSPETPMERQLNRMGSQLVVIGLGVCGAVFVVGLLRGYTLFEMVKTSIFLAVAAVPEGLPTVATTTLALGLRNMRRHHVLIRRLDAVEALGAVQTLCLDKTGTLTMNRMSVAAIHVGGRRLRLKEGFFIGDQGRVQPETSEELLQLIQVCILCNETDILHQGEDYVLQGSSTENALIYMAISSGIDVLKLRSEYPLLKMNHRSENNNMMSTQHLDFGTGADAGFSRLVALKGSPLEVLAICRDYMEDGKIYPLTEETRLRIQIENEKMAGEALRVLGVAYMHGPSGESELANLNSLTWLGLVGMADPIRDGVHALMDRFHRAGIDTVMITGDQGPTAYAIGKELRLSRGESLEILDSTQLNQVDPEILQALAQRVHVFARVSPAHKLQIVQALQKAGKVVAMTGDGVNDGPALKAADIGIAMGHTGTDVARDVADVVLEDDNLETMIIAVSHGRTIYGNIRKSVRFLLATNLSEIIVMFTAMAGGLGQPLNAMQLLWINLVSDIFPGLALALEPPEADVMDRPPRDPHEPIIKTSDLKRIAVESSVISAGALTAYGYGIMRYGMGATAGTLAFMGLTVGQLLHTLSCRSETHSIFDATVRPPNRYLHAALGGSLVFQGLAMTVPGLRNLLGLTPIGLLDGCVVAGGAVVPLLINEMNKTGKMNQTGGERQ